LAESLFRDGRELMEKGDYIAACPKLSESFAQDPATGTLLALAVCQEQIGQTASAWANYTKVISLAKREGRTDREQAAEEHSRALEPKLSRLTVEVDLSAASLTGFIVTRDGVAMGKGAWGASAPVDPGEHVIEATAPGKRAWRSKVTIESNADSQVVRVPSLEDQPTEDSDADRGMPPLRTVGIAVGGAGLVAFGVSGYFALHAKSLNTESKNDGHCDADDRCDAAGLRKRNDAISAATGATVALVAGGILTATGVTLIFVGGSKETKPGSARLEAAPLLSPGMAAILARGSF
jgi:hypothetical protein